MKIKLSQTSPDTVPYRHGVLYTRDTRWGPVVQAWPRKRKVAPGSTQWWYNQQFKIAAQMTKNPIWSDYQTAVEMVKGTDMVPRDFLTQCCYGTAYLIVDPDGNEWEPSYKGPPTPPPPPEEEHMWQWSLWDLAWNNSPSNTNFACKGCMIQPRANAEVTGFRSVLTAFTSRTYRAIIAETDQSGLILDILATAEENGLSFTWDLMHWDLTASLEAGKHYALLICCTSETPTTTLTINTNQRPRWLWPVDPGPFVDLASIDPQVGNQLNQGSSANSIPVGLRIKA